MSPTLLPGDRVIVNKLAFDLKVPLTLWHVMNWAGPVRGDVVVFDSPLDHLRLIKRVIGVGGDQVQLLRNHLIVNGVSCNYEAAGDAWIEKGDGPPHPINADFRRDAVYGPAVVPADMIFVMGDHRDGIIDSRNFGCISRRAIVGRVQRVGYSLDPKMLFGARWERWAMRVD